MADVFTKEKRSEVMSRIRSRGNKNTELRLMALMREHGITGWRRQIQLRVWKSMVDDNKRTSARHQPSTKNYQLKVRPDFIFRLQRVVIFVDGCFWHGCPRCYRRPKQNRKFWDTKVVGNQARDRKQSRLLKTAGWRVLRLWECALTPKNTKRTMARVRKILEVA